MALPAQWGCRTSRLGVSHGKRFDCGSIEVTAIRTSHDVAEPLRRGGDVRRFDCRVFTDLGEWDESTVDAMSGANVIIVEANHNLRNAETWALSCSSETAGAFQRGPSFQ